MTPPSSPDFVAELEEIIAGRSLLRHPFYQRWAEGKLTLDSLRGYARQYYHHVLAFPTYVSGAHANCDDLGDRQELLENLIEEERGEKNHPELWLRFGEALGLAREEMVHSEPLPETSALIETFRDITRNGSFPEGAAALYAYESQVPDVAATKIDGLKQFYGISDRRGLEFFIVHKSLDVEHSRVTRDLVVKHAQDEETRDRAKAAARRAASALWGFLDGVYREYVAAAVA
ncbi:MAG: CADD family putative folate metabolism protein [Chloroflexi bacterium]|nr:CADD family putative folate metabolism protein [Chloroflexota bacterium]